MDRAGVIEQKECGGVVRRLAPRDRNSAALKKCGAASFQNDAQWADAHLRTRDDDVLLDLANILRVLERHGDFAGRYLYARDMGKVLDRGVVMPDWRIYALAAEIQERFLPGVCEQLVRKGLLIAANRNSERY